MEIGGYLEFERYHGDEYHKNCLKINTARNCLKYLIEARQIRKLWISRWNCSAVLDTCRDSGIELGYFDLDEEFKPILPSEYKPEDYVYVVNYYGQLPEVHYEHMIIDNVQAFFQRPSPGIDTIYTCRKFFGVTDGAYLYTDARIGRELEQDVSHPRVEYLAGRFEKSASEFFLAYQDNEERLDSLPLMKMSAFTENILKSIDYEFVRRRREENFTYLSDRLKQYNLLNVNCPVGPFVYPLLVKNGQKIRKRFQSEKIYIAKLWPNVIEGKEGELSDNILPIPCDQRYGKGQMKWMVNRISEMIELEENNEKQY